MPVPAMTNARDLRIRSSCTCVIDAIHFDSSSRKREFRPSGVFVDAPLVAAHDDNPATHDLECIHDDRLVRAAEIPAALLFCGHSDRLVDRLRRILLCGPGEPHWLQPWVYRRAAENHPGSHHADSLRALCSSGAQGTDRLAL